MRSFPSRTFRLIALSLALVALLFSGIARGAETYSFAVAPQFEQRKLFAIWKPIVDELVRRTGLELRLVTTLTVPDFERAISKGTFDIVYANPYHIVREASRQGYVPLVRDKTPLRGILVVRKDDPIQSPAELAGKALAVPSLNAIGPLLVRVDLEHQFNAKVLPQDVKTHSSVYLHTVNGLLPAGAGVNKTLQEQAEAIRDNLRILYTTREMPPHPVAAHPRLPKDVRERVQQALLAMAQTDHGKALLAEVPIKEAIPTSLQDYQPMTKWGLERYWIE